jgi:hypothetical protein
MLREKVARTKIVSRLANVPPCLIGIEAGMGTHYVTGLARPALADDRDCLALLDGISRRLVQLPRRSGTLYANP